MNVLYDIKPQFYSFVESKESNISSLKMSTMCTIDNNFRGRRGLDLKVVGLQYCFWLFIKTKTQLQILRPKFK